MPAVAAIYVAPVKSLALSPRQQVNVTYLGIEEDRRFFLVDARHQVVTQRQVPQLALIRAEYQPNPELLTLRFPNGATLAAPPERQTWLKARIFGQPVAVWELAWDWSAALSDYCSQPVRLVKAVSPGQGQDECPVSLLGRASVDALNRRPDAPGPLEVARFRPTFMLEGGAALEEDAWLGRALQVGAQLRLRVVKRDSRCGVINIDPATGQRNLEARDTLRAWRPELPKACLGVYAMVEEPGVVSLGDAVKIVD